MKPLVQVVASLLALLTFYYTNSSLRSSLGFVLVVHSLNTVNSLNLLKNQVSATEQVRNCECGNSVRYEAERRSDSLNAFVAFFANTARFVHRFSQLVLMSLDRVRNRLLAYNTILSLIAVCVGSASLVGSFFGMNLVNHLEDSEVAWENVVLWTCVAVGVICVVVGVGFYKMGVM